MICSYVKDESVWLWNCILELSNHFYVWGSVLKCILKWQVIIEIYIYLMYYWFIIQYTPHVVINVNDGVYIHHHYSPLKQKSSQTNSFIIAVRNFYCLDFNGGNSVDHILTKIRFKETGIDQWNYNWINSVQSHINLQRICILQR